MQAGADGAVARSSFVSSVSKLMLERFREHMSEECELRLESSVRSFSDGSDDESLRTGLSQVFDCLDVNATHLVDAHQLIALLSLLSEGDMDSRLFFMIAQSSPQLGDITYVKSMTPIIRAFFLFFDHLLPAVFYFKHVRVPRFSDLDDSLVVGPRLQHEAEGDDRRRHSRSPRRRSSAPRGARQLQRNAQLRHQDRKDRFALPLRCVAHALSEQSRRLLRALAAARSASAAARLPLFNGEMREEIAAKPRIGAGSTQQRAASR